MTIRSAAALLDDTDGSPESRREDARRHLLESLDDQLELHDASLAERGASFASHISQFRWNAEARRFSCSLAGDDSGDGSTLSIGSAEELEVQIEIELPSVLGERVRAACSCPRSRHGRSRCEHTWAALDRCVDLLRHGEGPLFDQVLDFDTTPAWKQTLATLDGFLPPPAKDDAEDLAPEKRLTWRVRVTAAGVDLGAWEQRLSQQDGEWTTGRHVSWERLRDAPELWTCEADRRAVSAVRESQPDDVLPGPLWHLDVFAALGQLAGHPLVFRWEDARRVVSVEKVQLGLMVSLAEEEPELGPRPVPEPQETVPEPEGTAGDGPDPKLGQTSFVLDAALGDHPLRSIPSSFLHEDADQRGLLALIEGDDGFDRLLVARSEPRVLDFVRTLDGRPRIVPPEGHGELLARLTRLETILPVRLPQDLVDELRPADRRLYVRLAPVYPSGVAAQLRVRPAPQGYYCLPGEGPRRLTGLAEGHRVAVDRRREHEKERAFELVHRLGLDEVGEERPWQWRMWGDDEALDLVYAVQAESEDNVVVEWPAGGRRTVQAQLEPASLKLEVATKGDWFRLKGDVEIDGWRLSLLELLIALKRGRRYVRLGNGDAWVQITEEFQQRLEALDDIVHMNRENLLVDVTGAPVLRGLMDEEDGVVLTASRKFRSLLDRLGAADDLECDQPANLNAQLRSYQLEGYRWMRRLAIWGVGGCLADDMGLGKTIQSLALLLDRAETGPALVVAPTSLGFNWQREAARFAPSLRVVLYREAKKRDKVVESVGPGDVVVISYGLLAREVERLGSVRWGTLVLDEAQAIKNSRTKTSQATRKIEAKWRLALSGTPIENHLGELWSLFRTVSPGLFGKWDRFRDRFAAPIEKEGDTERRQALSRLVRPFILRRTKSEVLHELPERTEVELYVELSDDEQRLYEDTRLEALVRLADLESSEGPDQQQRFQVLAVLTRLRQLACHPSLVEPAWAKSSSKLDLLLEILDELKQEGHRALVFSQFTRHLELIRGALEPRGITYQYLDGQTRVRERGRRVDLFQEGDDDVFLISLMAGGTGLNLTAADYVIHMDPWWNPAVEDQATDRAHRMGQKRPVTVYRLVSRGTIEEEILRLHADKRDLMAGVLAGTDRAGQLTTDELMGLIRSGDDDEDE